MAFTADIPTKAMKVFEGCYNANFMEESANFYADKCLVTVNGGIEKGGPFTGHSPSDVRAFLDNLRNKMGATNIKFVVTKVYSRGSDGAQVHEDLWESDCGCGACLAVWEEGNSGVWKITSDQITFWPNNGDGSRSADYLKAKEEFDASKAVPVSVVCDGMKLFEDAYNKDDTQTSADTYRAETHVTVNGGVEEGGPFTGKTPAEVHGFLDQLRNKMGATNIKFTVTKVYGNTHEDTWTCDCGTGACLATWEKQADGKWKITSDEITFVPKA